MQFGEKAGQTKSDGGTETKDAKDAKTSASDASLSKKLRVQIASDLHIEFWTRDPAERAALSAKKIVKKADVLALLGDIGCPCEGVGFEQYKTFLLEQADRFDQVLVLAGNHEYYCYSGKHSVEDINASIRSVCAMRPGKLHFLNRNSLVIGGVRIAGCTLWSAIESKHEKEIQRMLVDYHRITVNTTTGGRRLVTPKDTLAFHQADVEWLVAQAKEAKSQGQKLLVLTHHAPSKYKTSHPKFDGSSCNSAFASSLDHLLNYGGDSDTSTIHTWAYGHTHYQCDQYIGKVHVVANQGGYVGVGEDDNIECVKKYNPEFVVEID